MCRTLGECPLSKIKAATVDDVSDLVALNGSVHALHADLYPDDFKHQPDMGKLSAMFSGLLTTDAHVVAICREGFDAKGYVWFEIQERVETPLKPCSRCLYIHHLSVVPTDRRRGVATALINWAEDFAAGLGIRQIALDGAVRANAPLEF